MQKLLAFIVSCHRLAVGGEALGPPVHGVVTVCVGMEAGTGSAAALQTTRHGVDWTVQKKNHIGLTHLTRTAQEKQSRYESHCSELQTLCCMPLVPLVLLYVYTLHQYKMNFSFNAQQVWTHHFLKLFPFFYLYINSESYLIIVHTDVSAAFKHVSKSNDVVYLCFLSSLCTN